MSINLHYLVVVSIAKSKHIGEFMVASMFSWGLWQWENYWYFSLLLYISSCSSWQNLLINQHNTLWDTFIYSHHLST